ncbi:MAG: nitrous oxide reductase accessory protein NosL [FCB group bacterium]|nr:nitrous oxide reductase accessory protein NosL [FCB group bacterium]MBL7029336.1 nitrous oxide reductase accessory protein NosL [Candidatus Neomarinimicrobiota bacterium]MBL7120729.1 nitrous oxide reductase accessory protein NosL [Candidatus Neomarinimicrobiota bacterium]
MIKSMAPISVFLIAILLVSCEPTIQAINYGQDGCSYCRMTIVEEHYGSELLTTKGKAHKFDSIECLAAFVIKGEVATEKIHDLYFTDFEDAGNLYPLQDMIFVQAKKLKSPMGLNLSAFRTQKTADDVALLYFGETMNWEQVQIYVETAWLK